MRFIIVKIGANLQINNAVSIIIVIKILRDH